MQISKAAVRDWIAQHGADLDSAIASACRECWERWKGSDNFLESLVGTQHEFWKLSRGEDANYGQPTIGLSYALWYHPRRIYNFLFWFVDHLVDVLPKAKVTIVDLGAGTGAVRWAIGLVAQALTVLGSGPNSITFHSVDNSQFMLNFSQNFLLPKFEEILQNGMLNITDEYHVCDWAEPFDIDQNSPIFTANYLFNQADDGMHVAANLLGLAEHHPHVQVLCCTAGSKSMLLESIIDCFDDRGYNCKINKPSQDMEFPSLSAVNALRAEIKQHYNAVSDPKFFQGDAGWNGHDRHGKGLICRRRW